MGAWERMGVGILLTFSLACGALACGGGDEGDADGADTGGQGDGALELTWAAQSDAFADGALLSGWASGPDDVWLVGGEQGKAIALHWTGTGWERPSTGLSEPLWWVHGFGDGSLAVVGDRGALAVYDGAAWSPIDSGVPDSTLYGVWGTSATDLWIVGGPSFWAQQEGQPASGAVLRHYDGAQWDAIDVDTLIGSVNPGRSLYKVWGTATGAIAVGDGGTALHFDGAAWRVEPTPAGSATLFTVTGRADDDAWAIGGIGNPVLIHWDGQSWTDVPLPPSRPSVMQGVWARPGTPVFVSGWSGFAAAFDENAWTEYATAQNPAYHAIFGAGKQMWLVGGDIQAAKADYVGAWATTDSRVGAP